MMVGTILLRYATQNHTYHHGRSPDADYSRQEYKNSADGVRKRLPLVKN